MFEAKILMIDEDEYNRPSREVRSKIESSYYVVVKWEDGSRTVVKDRFGPLRQVSIGMPRF